MQSNVGGANNMMQTLLQSQQACRRVLPSTVRSVASQALANRDDSPSRNRNGPTEKSSKQKNSVSGSERNELADEVRAFAKLHHISGPQEVKTIRGQKDRAYGLRVQTCARHTFSLYHMKVLGPHLHALTYKSLSLYADKAEREPLWQWFESMAAPKAVLRTVAQKRAKKAFRAALEARGYDRYGRRDATKTGSGAAAYDELYGTVKILVTVHVTAANLEHADLTKYFCGILRSVIEPSLGRVSSRRRRSA